MVHHCEYTDNYPSRIMVSIDKEGNRLIIDSYGKESYFMTMVKDIKFCPYCGKKLPIIKDDDE